MILNADLCKLFIVFDMQINDDGDGELNTISRNSLDWRGNGGG